jgi:hypothetical protein
MPVCDQFKQDLRQELIQDYYHNFDVLSGNNWFVGIAKPIEWVSSTGENQDASPPKNIDTVKNDTDFWRNALAFKKITKDDVSIVIPRYDWQSNQIYTPYRDNVDLFDDTNPAIFYVLVDEERVYKCIDNNYDSASTVAPTHTDYQIRTTSDGYRWKYLYSISESKRKFLTKSSGTNFGYMPVEYVLNINENDDRTSQYEVQNNAVDGSIDFIDLNQSIRSTIVTDRALFYSSSNQVSIDAPGLTTYVTIGGSKLVFENDYYNNMVIRFEDGNGAGQQRTISQYINNGNSTSTVILDNPLNYGVSGGASPTHYSILPNIVVQGDGEAAANILNTYSESAEIVPTFLSTESYGSTGQRYLDRFELINNGKNYTYAIINVVTGLTFASGTSGDFLNLATAVMSPIGGHGSNAVKELGASSLMISVDFSQSENNKLTVDNDYRQFCLIKNPQLSSKQVRLNLMGGLPASFTAGNTVTQGYTGSGGSTGYDIVSGTVVDWNYGTIGKTGTSELTVKNITGGDFSIRGFINGLSSQQIVRINEITVAGNNQRLLKRLKLVPSGGTAFDSSGYDFTPNYIVFGGGNSASNVSPSLSTGRVYNWEITNGTNTVGNLYLENSNGNFVMSENVYQFDNYYQILNGPIGKIIEIDEYEQSDQSVYDQTLRFNVTYDGSHLFDDNSFPLDAIASNASASGYVMDWIPATGATNGELRVLTTDGAFEVGQNLIYTNSGITGATITSIISEPEFKYRSGTIVHIQNIRPVTRSIEQKEEIKLIVQF